MKFTRAVVVVQKGESDRISIYMDGASPQFPKLGIPPCLEARAEEGLGFRWVRNNFPEVEVSITRGRK